MHFYGWKKGLKTGMYYLRTRPAAAAIQFTVDASILKEAKANTAAASAAAAAPKPAPAPVAARAPASEPTVESVTNGVNALSVGPAAVKLEPESPTIPPAGPAAGISERAAKAAAEDPEFAEALRRQAELDEARLQCSIDNKEACLMCSG